MPNKNSSSLEEQTKDNTHACPISLEELRIANANDFILVKVITGQDACSYYFIHNSVQNQFFGLSGCSLTRATEEYKVLYLTDLSGELKEQAIGLTDTTKFNLFLENEELKSHIKTGSFKFKTVATNPATTLQEFKNLLACYPLQKHAIIDPANNESLRHYFARKNKTEFVEALMTDLHDAAVNGETEKVISLITDGAEKEAIDDNGKTPLHLAAANGHTETALALITHGAEKEAKDSHGSTPLHLAVHKGHTETVKALIDAGAEINTKDNHGYTTLHGAAANGHTSTVNALIAANADINARYYGGLTPLHWAVYKGHTETVKVLINHGACVKGGWMVLLGATLRGKTKVVKAVMTHKISNIARSVRQLLSTPSLRGICCNHQPPEANQFDNNIETFIETSGNHPPRHCEEHTPPTALAQGGSDAAMTGIKETTAKADSKNLI